MQTFLRLTLISMYSWSASWKRKSLNLFTVFSSSLKKLFNYKKTYNSAWSTNTNKWTYSKSFTEEELDSLATTNAEKLFFANFYFSPAFMGETSRYDQEAIKNYCLTNDSLIFTSGTVLYNPLPGAVNPAFTNADGSVGEWIDASNGMICALYELGLEEENEENDDGRISGFDASRSHLGTRGRE